jgi:hypothetical protein
MPRGVKVGGLRSAADREAQPSEDALPDKKQGRYQFRSARAAYILSLRRRRIERGPDNEAIEVAPRSKEDTPLDWVHFENHYFETTDKELADLIKTKPGYRTLAKWNDGGEFWSLDDEKAAQDAALEVELRRMLEANPKIAERVLRPGKSEDFTVPPVA